MLVTFASQNLDRLTYLVSESNYELVLVDGTIDLEKAQGKRNTLNVEEDNNDETTNDIFVFYGKTETSKNFKSVYLKPHFSDKAIKNLRSINWDASTLYFTSNVGATKAYAQWVYTPITNPGITVNFQVKFGWAGQYYTQKTVGLDASFPTDNYPNSSVRKHRVRIYNNWNNGSGRFDY